MGDQAARTSERSGAEWKRVLAPYRAAHTPTAVWQLVNTVIPAALLWLLMLLSLEIHYGLTLLLAIPAALLRLRMFVLQHDCGHRSFLGSRLANDVVGRMLSIATLTPYAYWRLAHAQHHATSGNLDRRGLGDIDILTVDEYLKLSRFKRLVYRIYRHPFVLFGLGGPIQFIVLHRFPYALPKPRRRAWASVMTTNLCLAAVVVMLGSWVGYGALLLIEFPVIFGAANFGIWIFYAGHNFEVAYWARQESWDARAASLAGSSLLELPSWLQRTLGHIGLHHIHHLSSSIPNYRLMECHRAMPNLSASRLSVRAALASTRLGLWDETQQRAIRFSQLPG